jgi:hypothetical protein
MTAMQEFEKWLNDKWSDPNKLISCAEVSRKIDELIIKEEIQIMQAHDDGLINGICAQDFSGELDFDKLNKEYYKLYCKRE